MRDKYIGIRQKILQPRMASVYAGYLIYKYVRKKYLYV